MSAPTSLEARLSVAIEALEIIAGKRQCLDNLMGNSDVAEQALSTIADGERYRALVLNAFDQIEDEDKSASRRHAIERKTEAHFKAKQRF